MCERERGGEGKDDIAPGYQGPSFGFSPCIACFCSGDRKQVIGLHGHFASPLLNISDENSLRFLVYVPK